MTTKTAYKTLSRLPPPSNAMNPSKTNFPLLSFLLQALLMMALLISLFFLFLCIAALIVIHLCIAGRALRWDISARNDLHHFRFPASSLTGLTSKDLQKLPSFSYDPAGIGTAGTGECPVCLDGFKDGEACRVLPVCRHAFHAQCVDRWLARVSACPVCRARVVGLKFDIGGGV